MASLKNVLMRIVAVFAASGLSVIGAGAIAGVDTITAVTVAGGVGGGFANFNPIGSSGDGGGLFVLRGQDLLLATNRAQKASNLNS